MRSLQAFTYEIDDIDKAVTELDKQIDRSKLLKNSFALVFCGYEVDLKKLTAAIKKTFPFPFAGCTGLGILSSSGYSQMSIAMLVMTADDCDFAYGYTEEIDSLNEMEKVRAVYESLKPTLPEKEKLILTYAPWRDYNEPDKIIETLDECSGGVPIFGGISSDLWKFKYDRVFLNDEVSKKKVVIILISGNIKPVFHVAQSAEKVKNFNKTVTNAEGPVVYTLDDEPIVDYLERNGFITDKTEVMYDYLATPFISTMTTEDGDEIDILRSLVSLDHKRGSGRFIGRIEEFSKINMTLISKKDVEDSSKKAFDSLFKKMKENTDYEYSTILCSSCSARYCLIVSDKNSEGRAYSHRLPEGVNLIGYYGHGEFCPIMGKKSGKLYNVVNNETLAIIAF